MFEQPRNADFWSSAQTVPASFSPTAADNGMGATIAPILDITPGEDHPQIIVTIEVAEIQCKVSEQVLCQTPDNAYGNMQNAITHTLQGKISENNQKIQVHIRHLTRS
jgi:hypothetical protein